MTVSDATPYEVLGLEPGATQAEIKLAYRRLVRVTHPDAGGTDALFRQVDDAYRTLVDGRHEDVRGDQGSPPPRRDPRPPPPPRRDPRPPPPPRWMQERHPPPTPWITEERLRRAGRVAALVALGLAREAHRNRLNRRR
ncbi:MAG: J domain-containing protein [Actinobacteria bacterium]|nr:J domain-containing protein [Actinomycetota bacterium]